MQANPPCCRGSLTKLVIAEAGNFPEIAEYYRTEVSHRMRHLVESIIADGIARGEFRPCVPAAVARLLIAPVLMTNIWRHTFGDSPEGAYNPTDMARDALSIVLHGIFAQTKDSPR